MAERRSRRVRQAVVWVPAVCGVLRGVVPRLLGNERGRDAVRRFNRRWLNPVMLRMAGRPNWYAARLEHVGRRSGRTVRDAGRGEAGDGWVCGAAAVRQARGLAAQPRGGRPRPAAGRRAAVSGREPADRAPRGDRGAAPRVLPAHIGSSDDPGMAGVDRRAGCGCTEHDVGVVRVGVTGGQASGRTESPRRTSETVAPSKRIG